MTVELLKGTLAWSAVLNIGILLWWFLFLTFAHDWVYKLHSKLQEAVGGPNGPFECL